MDGARFCRAGGRPLPRGQRPRWSRGSGSKSLVSLLFFDQRCIRMAVRPDRVDTRPWPRCICSVRRPTFVLSFGVFPPQRLPSLGLVG